MHEEVMLGQRRSSQVRTSVSSSLPHPVLYREPAWGGGVLGLQPINGSPLQLLFWAQGGSQGLWSTEECGPTALRKELFTEPKAGWGDALAFLMKGIVLNWKFTQGTLKPALQGI